MNTTMGFGARIIRVLVKKPVVMLAYEKKTLKTHGHTAPQLLHKEAHQEDCLQGTTETPAAPR